MRKPCTVQRRSQARQRRVMWVEVIAELDASGAK
jgi:hypothetical protein